MYKDHSILSFIGARSGSKGLKNKNKIDFAGKPLIAWTIEASLNLECIDYTIVSTDDSEIISISECLGANIPFVRPYELSQDNSSLIDAAKHSIEWLEEKSNLSFKYILLLQPTSPLRTIEHIKGAIEYYFENRSSEIDTLVSVTELPKKFEWIMKKTNDHYVDFCFLDGRTGNCRQELGECFIPNGAIYFGPVEAVSEHGFYNGNTLPYIMDEDVSVDIDTKEDFERALKLKKNG